LFTGRSTSDGWELYKTDGTAGGTKRLADSNPGSGSSLPSYLMKVGENVFFQADDGENGTELWKSDGTRLGTGTADLYPGPSASYPNDFTKVGKQMFFTAEGEDIGTELWKMSL
jgi:ELWxxDGT repeat protein